MSDSPKITIGILNRNGLHYLRSKVLPAIQSQNYRITQVIVLDNNSNDGSPEYLQNNPGIELLSRAENIGYGAGKNALVERAKGEYVLLLDNDIELPDGGFVEKLLNRYSVLKKPAYLSPLLVDIGKDYIDTGWLCFNRKNIKIPLQDIYDTGTFAVPRYRGGICFFRKEIFEDLGGFDTVYPFNIDDYDMSARAYLAGYRNYRCTDLTAIHLGVESRIQFESVLWKLQYYFCGFSRMIWKNYSTPNLLRWWPVSVAWMLLKYTRKSMHYHSTRPLAVMADSVRMFCRDFPGTLRIRNQLQRWRREPRDLFLMPEKLRRREYE